MSVGYQLVIWNANKRYYDLWLTLGIVLFIGCFMGVSLAFAEPGRDISPPILLIRAFGTCAFVMLTMILMIGPLARLNKVFLPLLYNRRHFGVATFLVALVHFIVTLGWYHGFGEVNPFVSIFANDTQYADLSDFPFQTLGFIAFTILFIMAATSHDFWLNTLSAGVWKALHMLVYVAYGAVVMHIALGILQDETSGLYWSLLGTSIGLVGSLHLVTGVLQMSRDSGGIAIGADWREVAKVQDIALNRAKVVPVAGAESIAVFRYENKISAVSNVCKHQGGPLGEGRVIDGCITCPWHGYQYKPEDGCSPPPFTEKINTYRVKVENDTVYVDPTPLPPGTPVDPAIVSGEAAHG